MTTSLYRHFDHEGILLYVGISLSWPARTKQHASGSRWFDQVARVEIQKFDTRAAALEAEREAIIHEAPKFNIVHNRSSQRQRNLARPSQPKPFFEDPLLAAVTGPHAIVGPALVYTGDEISIFVAHGEPGTAGHLIEFKIGKLAAEHPEWAHLAAAIISIRSANEFTMEEANDFRREIVAKLRQHLQAVDVCESDLALAVAYAATFPSKKSRKVLDDIVAERGWTR